MFDTYRLGEQKLTTVPAKTLGNGACALYQDGDTVYIVQMGRYTLYPTLTVIGYVREGQRAGPIGHSWRGDQIHFEVIPVKSTLMLEPI